MRECRQLPGPDFFFIQHEVDDFREVGIRLLVIVLKPDFEVREGASNGLEEIWWDIGW